jgi:hypothetical protein
MKITFKLFAMLADHLPNEVDGARREGNQIQLQVPEGITVQQMIERFNLPAKLVRFIASEGGQAQAREWITRFDQHTQRGGG